MEAVDQFLIASNSFLKFGICINQESADFLTVSQSKLLETQFLLKSTLSNNAKKNTLLKFILLKKSHLDIHWEYVCKTVKYIIYIVAYTPCQKDTQNTFKCIGSVLFICSACTFASLFFKELSYGKSQNVPFRASKCLKALMSGNAKFQSCHLNFNGSHLSVSCLSGVQKSLD